MRTTRWLLPASLGAILCGVHPAAASLRRASGERTVLTLDGRELAPLRAPTPASLEGGTPRVVQSAPARTEVPPNRSLRYAVLRAQSPPPRSL